MELNFLTIADAPEDLHPLRGLLASFEREKQIQISVRRVGWERAWQALLMDAVEGKGPHVSQIGSTWVATMAMLDALRCFTKDDVSAVGGSSCFLPSAWESVNVKGHPEVWAIPWSIYTFVLYYRRDMLEKAGIDPATAFVTAKAMHNTFMQLVKNKMAPWAFPSLNSYADLVHIASSWARVNRGDLAAMIGGVEVGNELMESPYASQEMRENVAVTTLPGVPWIGGDHLVIWKNILTDPEREKSALDLVTYLSDKGTQIQYFNVENILPARMDAYDELTFPLETTKPTLEKILKMGRPHPTLRLWRRIEAFLDTMLLDIGNAVLRQPTASPSDITLRMLEDYEQRLSAVLE